MTPAPVLATLSESASGPATSGAVPHGAGAEIGVDQLLAALCGAGIGLGLFLLLRAVLLPSPGMDGRPGPSWAQSCAAAVRGRWRALGADPRGRRGSGPAPRFAIALGVAVLVGAFTRWPVAAFLAALGAWFAPQVLRGDRATAQRVARIEAVAAWTEMLRDTLASAAGLEQAITATAATAPAPIRGQVQALAARLDRGEPLAAGLRRLADDLDDPTADLVVAALVLAAQHQARNLTDLLASLALAARDQATMRLRVSAGRARVRTTVRIIAAVTVAMAAGLTLLNRPYLAVYGSPGGQIVLAAIGGVFALALAWLMRIATINDPPRVLTGLHTLATTTSSAGDRRTTVAVTTPGTGGRP